MSALGNLVAIQYQSWFSFRAQGKYVPYQLPERMSQSSINPGFHSELNPEKGCWAKLLFGRNPVSILVFIPRWDTLSMPTSSVWMNWSQSSINPGFHSESAGYDNCRFYRHSRRNPVSILVFIPRWRVWQGQVRHCHGRNPVSILVFIPRFSWGWLVAIVAIEGRNPVSILVFIPR